MIDAWLPHDMDRQASIVLVQDTLYEVILEYRPYPPTRLSRTTKVAFLHLQWQSAFSSSMTAIPPLNLFSATTVELPPAQRSFVIRINAGPPSHVWYRGGTSGVAGTPFRCSFYSVDAQGNIRTPPLDAVSSISSSSLHDHFRGRMRLRSNPHVIVDAEIAPDQDAMTVAAAMTSTSRDKTLVAMPFQAAFDVTVAGVYDLTFELDSAMTAMHGFPLAIMISPGQKAGPRTIVTGPGILTTGNIAARVSTMTLHAKDLYGNLMTSGGSVFEVRAIFNMTVSDLGTVLDRGNGQYDVQYTPRFSGTYRIEIKVHGIHVASSPYEIIVEPNIAYGPSCFILSGTSVLSRRQYYLCIINVCFDRYLFIFAGLVHDRHWYGKCDNGCPCLLCRAITRCEPQRHYLRLSLCLCHDINDSACIGILFMHEFTSWCI
jgi:hypothetical protein